MIVGPLGKDGMAVLEIVGIGTAASKPDPGLYERVRAEV
jgi:hypothetical protein